MLASVWMTTYMASGIGVFLPAIMLAVIRVPRIHQTGDSAQTPLTFVRLSRGGWIAMTVPLAVGHFLLLAAGEVALAATLRYAMLFMLIIAALRFQYKFYIQLLVGVVIYLLVAEAVLDGGVNMNPELPSLLRNTVINGWRMLSKRVVVRTMPVSISTLINLQWSAITSASTRAPCY
jgi:hypothetical protein